MDGKDGEKALSKRRYYYGTLFTIIWLALIPLITLIVAWTLPFLPLLSRIFEKIDIIWLLIIFGPPVLYVYRTRNTATRSENVFIYINMLKYSFLFVTLLLILNVILGFSNPGTLPLRSAAYGLGFFFIVLPSLIVSTIITIILFIANRKLESNK